MRCRASRTSCPVATAGRARLDRWVAGWSSRGFATRSRCAETHLDPFVRYACLRLGLLAQRVLVGIGEGRRDETARVELAGEHDIDLGGVHDELRGEEQEEEEPQDDAEEPVQLARVAELARHEPSAESLQRGPRRAPDERADTE